jgi:serine/threonine-protein kinase
VPPSPPPITLPERYRLVRHVANGGMASVWEAHDELLDRAVAVKVLASHLSEDDRARRRFQREARAVAGLSSHPHVVTIYDVGEHDGRSFIVMELLAGGSVADRLKAGEEIPVALALRWLGRPPRRSTPRTRRASSTATSSRPTCCSTSAAASRWPTSASRGWRGRTS